MAQDEEDPCNLRGLPHLKRANPSARKRTAGPRDDSHDPAELKLLSPTSGDQRNANRGICGISGKLPTTATAAAFVATTTAATAAGVATTLVAATAAATLVATTATAAIREGRTWFGRIDAKWATLEVGTIQSLYGFINSGLIRQSDECESARATRFTIGNDLHSLHITKVGEKFIQLGFCDAEGQIAHVNIHILII
jgi:hypothetical protein